MQDSEQDPKRDGESRLSRRSAADRRRLMREIASCRICADAFAATPTAHSPRPVLQISGTARVAIAGQAPGWRVQKAGRPFDDPSGVRLRGWLGVEEAAFWDPARFAILPMGFCFPGHDAKGGDLPPPKICAQTWRARLMAAHLQLDLILLLGRAAIEWHLGASARKRPLEALVGEWRARLSAPERPRLVPAPHPSWRNTAWLKKRPWFEQEAVPALRSEVAALIGEE